MEGFMVQSKLTKCQVYWEIDIVAIFFSWNRVSSTAHNLTKGVNLGIYLTSFWLQDRRLLAAVSTMNDCNYRRSSMSPPENQLVTLWVVRYYKILQYELLAYANEVYSIKLIRFSSYQLYKQALEWF